MKKRYRGSAILWAVCSLLVISFIVTGLLAVNKAYAAEEIQNISKRQAEYYARSAIDMTAELIENKSLSYTEIDITEDVIAGWYKWNTSEEDWFKKYVEGEVEKKTNGKRIKVVYDFDGNSAEVVIERNGDTMMRLTATASYGYAEETMIGVMEYKYSYEKWGWLHYVTY